MYMCTDKRLLIKLISSLALPRYHFKASLAQTSRLAEGDIPVGPYKYDYRTVCLSSLTVNIGIWYHSTHTIGKLQAEANFVDWLCFVIKL